ncbi:hypothetical protein EON65_53120, partial [archaeon]
MSAVYCSVANPKDVSSYIVTLLDSEAVVKVHEDDISVEILSAPTVTLCFVPNNNKNCDKQLFPVPIYVSFPADSDRIVNLQANMPLIELEASKALLSSGPESLFFLILNKSSKYSPKDLCKLFKTASLAMNQGLPAVDTCDTAGSNTDRLDSTTSASNRRRVYVPSTVVTKTTPLVIPTTTPAKTTESNKSDKPWQIPEGQIIPTLLPALLVNGQYELIKANTQPVYFKNAFFEGHMVFMVNSTSQALKEPFASKFRDDKNTFEVQIQGKFLQVIPPNCTLYVGAEITKKMELGLVTRGLCGSILNFCKAYSSHLHSSFGDAANVELPHIVAPLWNTIDRLVV